LLGVEGLRCQPAVGDSEADDRVRNPNAARLMSDAALLLS
jgi:hypothetical protein